MCRLAFRSIGLRSFRASESFAYPEHSAAVRLLPRARLASQSVKLLGFKSIAVTQGHQRMIMFPNPEF